MPSSSTDATIANGGTATLAGTGFASVLTVGQAGNGTLSISAGSLSVVSTSYLGQSGSTGTVTASGGTWDTGADLLAGYFGNASITISGGTVNVAGSAYVGYSGASTVTVSSGALSAAGELWLGVDAGGVTGHTGTLTISGGTVSASAVRLAHDLAASGYLNLNGGVVMTGTLIEDTGTGGGHVVFNGGTLRASAGNADFIFGFEPGDIQLAAGGVIIDSNSFNIGIGNVLQGSGGLVKIGGGTLTINAANTYKGNTTINAGTLTVSNTGSISESALVTVNTGGTLAAPNLRIGNVDTGGISVAGGTISVTGESYVGHTSPGFATVTSGTWTSGGALYVGLGASTGTFNLSGGSVSALQSTLGGAGLDTGSGSASVSGGSWTTTGNFNIGYSGPGTLTQTGGTIAAGTVILASEGSAIGTLNLNGGTLSALSVIEGAGTGGGHINFDGGTLRATGNNPDFISAFETGDLQLASGGAGLDTGSFTITIAPAFQGAGGLSKIGSGTLTLSGTSTYTGPTVVNAGTLDLSGSIATSSATTVNAGAKLTGTGTAGALTIASGGIVAPGAAPGTTPGTLQTGSITLQPSARMNVEINNATGVAGTNWDQLIISGNADITATSTTPFVIKLASLSLSNSAGLAANFNPASCYQFTFATVSGNITGFAANKFLIDTASFQNSFTGGWAISCDGHHLFLTYNSDAYDAWAAANLLTGPPGSVTDPAKTADPDGDGVSNLAEFAFHGDPRNSSSKGLFAVVLQDTIAPVGKELTYIIAVREGATFSTSGLSQTNTSAVNCLYYTVEGSLDLVFPGSAVSHVGSPSYTAPAGTGLPDLTSSGWQYHSFRLDASEGVHDKGFMRAKVSETP